MSAREEYRKANCPSCGAPLPLDEASLPRCPYCGTVLAKIELESPCEIWGVAATTGERKWQRFFEGEEPLEGPGAWAGQAWSWHLAPRGLLVLHLCNEPRRLVLETIDPQTGTSNGEVVSERGDDTWSWSEVTWGDNAAWATTTNPYAVDLVTDRLLWKWP